MEAFCIRRYGGGIKPNVVAFENGRWNLDVIEHIGYSSNRIDYQGRTYDSNYWLSAFMNNGSYSNYESCVHQELKYEGRIKNFDRIKQKYSNVRVQITNTTWATRTTNSDYIRTTNGIWLINPVHDFYQFINNSNTTFNAKPAPYTFNTDNYFSLFDNGAIKSDGRFMYQIHLVNYNSVGSVANRNRLSSFGHTLNNMKFTFY